MKKHIFILLILSGLGLLQAQSLLKSSYRLQGEGAASNGRLIGNGIVDLLPKDSLIWAATGYGLNLGNYNEQAQDWVWETYRTKEYIGKGGVSAMGYMDDSTLWIATAFDTTAQDEELPAGGGLSYTRDNGKSWTHVRQPVDSKDEDRYAPTTTVIQNLTYDIAFIDSTIWIASFGGGLRRSNDLGKTWQVVTTDGKFFSSLANLNHRAFSLLSVDGNKDGTGDTLWVGTADGISKSSDNGSTWTRFEFSKDDTLTISGNFVVALAYQEANHTIWAATIQAENSDEIRAVSISRDWGKTWQRLLINSQLFSHNFAFNGQTAYIASDHGLYWQMMEAGAWDSTTAIQDLKSGDEIFQQEYYSVAVQQDQGIPRLWAGNSDGMATRPLAGSDTDWRVIRSYVTISERPKPAVYGYPSPFSPSRHLYIRFEAGAAFDKPIRIFDFGMNEVAEIPLTELKPKWDGKSNGGGVVASGVYFFRATTGGQTTWGKIVVIN
jgi:hypothetical protein